MKRLLPAAIAAFALISAPAPALAQSLSYLGQQILPTGTMYAGTVVGGLSGIDYVTATGGYYVISDDRSQIGPGRFYGMTLDLSQFNRSATPGSAGVAFTAVETMKVPGSATATYPNSTLDPEALRFNPATNRVVWASEGDKGLLINPFVREMNLDGTFVRGFATPSKFNASDSQTGIRNNLAFESLTYSPDRTRLYTAVENALIQDGSQATVTNPSVSRVIAFDTATGTPVAEYAYLVDPVVQMPNPPGGFATNGLTEMLAVDSYSFIMIERSFSAGAPGTGNTIKLYLASLAGATDVTGIASLEGATFTAMSKSLLLDLGTLTNADGSPLALDNIEGITWGPTVDGKATLILVSDNNFSPTQFTQFIALSATQPIPEPSTWAMLAAGLLLVGALARRRARTG